MTAICIPVFIKPGINLEETIEEIEDLLEVVSHAGVRGMVELRCDQATPRLMLEAMDFAHAPAIVTVRPTWEGGMCEKDDEYRIGLWEQAIEAGVEYIDVELLAWEKNKNVRDRISEAAEKSGTRIILSNHAFEGTPKDLHQRVERLRRIKQADVLKIAFKADSILDAIEALKITARLKKEDGRPVLALAMGEEGLISRLLANKFGAAWTFATVATGAESAPGQPTVHDLLHKYRWTAQKPDSPVFGVAGWPVGHSKSPAMHNAGFDAVNAPGIYVPLAIKPGQFATVVDALRATPTMNFRGLSVTIPHKEAAFKYVCDRNGKVDDLSWRIGVLNTLVFNPVTQASPSTAATQNSELTTQNASVRGFNSDYEGAIDALVASWNGTRESLAGKRVAVLGAGGAARAVIAALAHYGAITIIYNRTREKADALAEDLGQGTDGRVIAGDWARLNAADADIFINCTPLGMHPAVEGTPMDASPASWNADTVVFDTVYTPPMTRLLIMAKEKGAKIVPGTEMFLRQAVAQFKAFTGQDAPLNIFREAIT